MLLSALDSLWLAAINGIAIDRPETNMTGIGNDLVSTNHRPALAGMLCTMFTQAFLA
jgi:hypothetical protein